MEEANSKISSLVLKGTWNPSRNIHFPWNHWSRGAGIIACKNEESMQFMIALAKTISFPGKEFRAWKKGQYGYSTLVTMNLPSGWNSFIKKEDIIPLIIKQNGLKGKHSMPKFKDGPSKGGLKEGIQLTMFISPELETGLKALGGCAAMAALSVKFKIAKSY